MRYLRLYLYFLRFSFSKAMHFRLDFFFRIVMDCVYYLVQFSFFHILFLHTNVLGGWNIEQMQVFISAYILVDALHMTIFSNNCWWLPILINRGDLDYYLTKPVSSLFFLSVRDFAANSFVNLIIASTIMIYFLIQYPGPLTTGRVLGFFSLIVVGTFLYYLVHLLFLLCVFWTQSPRGFGDLFFTVEKVMERPDGIFQGVLRKVFLFVLPFSLMASFPARFLFDENPLSVLLTVISVTSIFFCIVSVVWNKGLKSYSSASS